MGWALVSACKANDWAPRMAVSRGRDDTAEAMGLTSSMLFSVPQWPGKVCSGPSLPWGFPFGDVEYVWTFVLAFLFQAPPWKRLIIRQFQISLISSPGWEIYMLLIYSFIIYLLGSLSAFILQSHRMCGFNLGLCLVHHHVPSTRAGPREALTKSWLLTRLGRCN